MFGEMNNVVNLRSKLNINSQKLNFNDTVLVYDEMVPRQFSTITIVIGYYLVEILK